MPRRRPGPTTHDEWVKIEARPKPVGASLLTGRPNRYRWQRRTAHRCSRQLGEKTWLPSFLETK